MNFKYFLTISLLPLVLYSQSLTIYKNDNTTIDFGLSEIDSITFSTISQSIALDLENWECITTTPGLEYIAPAAGVFEKNEDGLKIYSSGSLINKAIHPVSVFQNPETKKTISLKWKVNGNANAITAGVKLYADTVNWNPDYQIMNLTANQSSGSSVEISDNVWYYTRISITDEGVFASTSTGNYYNNGGNVVDQEFQLLTNSIKTFSFDISGATNSYSILAEVKIE